MLVTRIRAGDVVVRHPVGLMTVGAVRARDAVCTWFDADMRVREELIPLSELRKFGGWS